MEAVGNVPCRQAPERLWQTESRRDSARKAGRDSTLGFSVPCPSGSHLDESLENTSFSQLCFHFWVAQLVKKLPAMQETQVRSLGWKEPLEKKNSTHSSFLAWRIPCTEDTVCGVAESQTTERLTTFAS